MQGKRTQEERSAATRAALLAAARPLFAARGYAAVGTPEIVAAAGVTRGALYHQFDDKLALFAAVVEQVEEEITVRIATVLVAGDGTVGPARALRAGADAWLDACREPEVQRIILVEAPAVLGWERWRDIALRYGMGLVTAGLAAAVEAGDLEEQPIEPLAHVLVGALDEAAIYIARAPDPDLAQAQVGDVLDRLFAGVFNVR